MNNVLHFVPTKRDNEKKLDKKKETHKTITDMK